MTWSPSFQPAGNLCLSIHALSKRHRAPAKLVGRDFDVYEGLILVVAQNGGIRQCDGIGKLARVDVRNDVHILFQFLAGIAVSMRACSVRVLGSRDAAT